MLNIQSKQCSCKMQDAKWKMKIRPDYYWSGDDGRLRLKLACRHTNCHIRVRISSCPASVVFNQCHHFDGRSTCTCFTSSTFSSSGWLSASSTVYISFDKDTPSWWNTSHISLDWDSKDSTYLAIWFKPSSKEALCHLNMFIKLFSKIQLLPKSWKDDSFVSNRSS